MNFVNMTLPFRGGVLLQRLLAPFSALTVRWSLTFELTKRDVLGRYRGASFGLFWSLLSPFLMLLIYTFAFGYALKSKWPHETGGDHPFAIVLYVGLIVHGFFSECLTRAPTLITSSSNLVKRVVFPLEILPWSVMLSALFHVGMNILVFCILRLVFEYTLTPYMLWLPVVFLPLLPLALGTCWLFSAFGVYLRDVGQVTNVLSTAMLFVSSAMIPVSSLPPKLRILFDINPLTYIIDQARVVSLAGRMPDFHGLCLYAVGSTIFMYIGYGFFMSVRRGFADVV